MNKSINIILQLFITGLIIVPAYAKQTTEKIPNSKCLKCHGDSSIEGKSERGKKLKLYVNEEKFSEGAHQKFYCIECHNNRDCPEFYKRPVEEVAKIKRRDCEECHKKYFYEQEKEFKKSVHHKNIKVHFNCTSCHNQHEVTPTLTEDNIVFYDVIKLIESDNTRCIDCHDNAVRYSPYADKEKPMPDIHKSHSFLPNAELHWKSVRCIDCHTPVDKMEYHNIISKDDTQHNCIRCHNISSMLTEKLYRDPYVFSDFKFINTGFFNPEGLIKRYKKVGISIPEILEEQEEKKQQAATVKKEGNILNKYLFKNAYVIGATRNTLIENILLVIMIIAGLGLSVHGVIRFITSRFMPYQAGVVKKEYLYSFQTRLWHWCNVVLFVFLIITGFNMHFADIKDSFLSFELSVKVHNVAAVLLLIGYLFYIISSIINGNIKNYIPQLRDIFTRLFRQSRFYLYDIFLRRPHPYAVQEGEKFNPLQKASYIIVMFVLFPVLIISGIVLFFPSLAPEKFFKLPGIYPVAMVHYITSMFFVIFLFVHIYLSTTGDRVLYLLKGMITGYHISEHKEEEKEEDSEE